MDKLFDNINFVSNEKVFKSELEIELNNYFRHKFVLTESEKIEIKIYRFEFFFKFYYAIYPKFTPMVKYGNII